MNLPGRFFTSRLLVILAFIAGSILYMPSSALAGTYSSGNYNNGDYGTSAVATTPSQNTPSQTTASSNSNSSNPAGGSIGATTSPAASAAQPTSSHWKTWVFGGMIGLAVLLLISTILRRHRKDPPAPPSVTITPSY